MFYILYNLSTVVLNEAFCHWWYPGTHLDGDQDLTWSLAMASPELQQCVTSCKHIAENTKQYNDFQKVSTVTVTP